MRPYGALNSVDQIPIVPDTVGSIQISSAGAVVAQDWPTNAQLVYFSPPPAFAFVVNYLSTQAAFSGASTPGSTAGLAASIQNPGIRQIPAGSTGYSITATSSGFITAEFWRK